MIKVAIIDDEENARYVLSKTLESYFNNIQIVGMADDVQTGIELIKKEKPELVFLDIKMKSGTGFDLLQKIDSLDFEVVFVTAYDNFAVQAFEYSAFDYLLKPVKIKDLKKVIERFALRAKSGDAKNSKRLKVLIENYSNGGKVNKIVISSNKGFDVVDLEDIIRLEGESNYTFFHLQTGRKITAKEFLINLGLICALKISDSNFFAFFSELALIL
jgi:two-component system LytT family response regulator